MGLKKSRKRPRIGDLVEISASGDVAYAQFTHKHGEFGSLVRVFEGVEAARSASPEELAQLPVQFTTFFPLGAACHRGIAEIIGTTLIRPDLISFPLLRFRPSADPRRGGDSWWLWDGSREWHVGALSSAERDLPLRAIMNDTLLVERALTGWRSARQT